MHLVTSSALQFHPFHKSIILCYDKKLRHSAHLIAVHNNSNKRLKLIRYTKEHIASVSAVIWMLIAMWNIVSFAPIESLNLAKASVRHEPTATRKLRCSSTVSTTIQVASDKYYSNSGLQCWAGTRYLGTLLLIPWRCHQILETINAEHWDVLLMLLTMWPDIMRALVTYNYNFFLVSTLSCTEKLHLSKDLESKLPASWRGRENISPCIVNGYALTSFP